METFKTFVKKFIPNFMLKKIRPVWHGFLAFIAAARFGFPSQSMVVIGITGTAGKTTTTQMLAAILNAAGKRTGFITTAGYSLGDDSQQNSHSLSMPGGFRMQGLLTDIHDAGCTHVIIECTSEGLAQNRHIGINFDVALLTNLHPAHLDAHSDSIENYRKAKGRLFETLELGQRKEIFREKLLGLNAEGEHAEYFAHFKADRKFAVINGTSDEAIAKGVKLGAKNMYAMEKIVVHAESVSFAISDVEFNLLLPGEFNTWNAGLAAATAHMLGVDLAKSSEVLAKFAGVSGRMETIRSAKGFRVVIDYAPEPEGMRQALRAVSAMSHQRLVHIFGSTGGHRDVAKRSEFGAISAEYADQIIITNDDVYESDPQKIADDVLGGVRSVPDKTPEEKIILDRREAISSAIQNAKVGDIILLTGKGSENFLVLPGDKRIAWNERKVVEELLKQNE
jgi:UDP-N-acetylmuramoyl-L-alanyl-D-glutamate--2,6-diaminopimelate ligase